MVTRGSRRTVHWRWPPPPPPPLRCIARRHEAHAAALPLSAPRFRLPTCTAWVPWSCGPPSPGAGLRWGEPQRSPPPAPPQPSQRRCRCPVEPPMHASASKPCAGGCHRPGKSRRCGSSDLSLMRASWCAAREGSAAKVPTEGNRQEKEPTGLGRRGRKRRRLLHCGRRHFLLLPGLSAWPASQTNSPTWGMIPTGATRREQLPGLGLGLRQRASALTLRTRRSAPLPLAPRPSITGSAPSAPNTSPSSSTPPA